MSTTRRSHKCSNITISMQEEVWKSQETNKYFVGVIYQNVPDINWLGIAINIASHQGIKTFTSYSKQIYVYIVHCTDSWHTHDETLYADNVHMDYQISYNNDKQDKWNWRFRQTDSDTTIEIVAEATTLTNNPLWPKTDGQVMLYWFWHVPTLWNITGPAISSLPC